MCLIKDIFWIYLFLHKAHSYVTFSSWMVLTWFNMLTLFVNDFGHFSHKKGFCPTWTDNTCLFLLVAWVKAWSHCKHWNDGIFPSWTFSWWCLSPFGLVNGFLHMLHLKTFDLIWISLECVLKLRFAVNVLLQIWHWNSFFISSSISFWFDDMTFFSWQKFISLNNRWKIHKACTGCLLIL